MGKLDAHRPPGALHRAFSVFLFRSDGRLLVQRRSSRKHHFRGRWSNTCCSHPRPGEAVLDAGRRRLNEELGLDAPLAEVGSFLYRATDADTGLVEREFDHVLVGFGGGVPVPDPAEVEECRWVPVAGLAAAVGSDPAAFTPWLPLALPLAVARLGAVGPGCNAG
jgi:isopentenyl-diphosphate delta-isomerase